MIEVGQRSEFSLEPVFAGSRFSFLLVLVVWLFGGRKCQVMCQLMNPEAERRSPPEALSPQTPNPKP